MSGAQTSTFGDPNTLYKTLSGAGYQEVEQNRLMNQGRERQLAADDIEMIGRSAGSLLGLPDEAARAAAYPAAVAQLQQYGVKAPLPATYPGEAALRRALVMGTPSAELFKLQGTASAVDAYGNSIGLTGTRPGGGGGGTTAAGGGADTAPINAAGDSRTRKAAEGGPPAAGTPGAAAAQQVHDFWRSKGFSEEKTAGIMAGGPGSESNFIPTASGDNGTSYGAYQHHATRLRNPQGTGLFDRYGPNPTLAQQNEYAYWEITQGPLKNVGEMLKNAKTAAEAATIWTQYFGVPADKSEIGRRARGADRFVNRYAGQPGAPGGSTAPGVIMGDVTRPGDVPPPPRGAPGAYGDGGFGAVVAQPPAARASPLPAGRPTGPPVITDQPAGSNVVAGPPGVAIVGAPQPAGPAVAGNVAAINAGIVGAGGQPVTDPNLTPTPARYAGTAPAPPAEAQPEAGWGSQVGSGYGPQNTLAPPPPQPPARPATTAAQQPPATTAQGLPPELQTDNNYLTPSDKQQLAPLFDQARRGLVPLTTLQNEVQQRQTFNVQRQKDFLAAQQQTMENARQVEADRRAAAEAMRQEQANIRAEEDAARKRAQDADPIKGTDDKANADRLLLKYVDGILDGSATPAQRRLYAEAAQYYLKPQMQWIDDPTDATKKQMVPVPGQLPDGFPNPSYKPGEQQPQAPAAGTKIDFKPLPETERKLLIDTATRIDQETQQRNLFKPEYAGFGNAAIGDFANAVARNNPIASKADTARAEWWQNYQRYKLAVRQGISGQSLTASELAEFDKADIHPGMTAQAVRDNLLQQDKVLRTAHERRVGSLAADRFSPDAIRAASGVDPAKVTVRPLTEGGAPKADTAPHPPGFKVVIP